MPYLTAPDPYPFLASLRGEPTADADVLVLGLPVDGGISFRGGAREGPSGVRRFSESIESYSPRLKRDLTDLRIVDVGDHGGPAMTLEAAVGELLDEVWKDERRPLLVTIGGDHEVTPPVVRAVAARTQRPLVMLGYDAHLDLREHYDGEHACTFRRIVQAGLPVFLLGVRSGAREEWEVAEALLDYVSAGLEVPRIVLPRFDDVDVYLSIDIDVLDPSVAPGTGNLEPGGPTVTQLLEALDVVLGMRVVALDVVEVSPPLDPSGVTQTAAALLLRELVLKLVR